MFNQLLLRTFLSVYRTGSQTAAAKELFLTQPAVSQHLKSLEERIGRPLFKREGKFIKPTVAADQLAFNISTHVDALDDIWQNLRSTQKAMGGTVYLGGIAEFFSVVIAPHLAKLTAQNINIKFEIGHDILLEKLLSNELDLAQFCMHVVHPGIQVELLYEQEWVLVGAPHWKKQISQSDLGKGDTTALDKIPWIAYDESLLFIKEYYQTIFNKSFNGRVALMVKDLWSVVLAVAGGAGITVLPSYFCQSFLKEKKLTVLYAPPKPLVHRFYLGWKDGAMRNPNVALARKILKSITGGSTLKQ